MEVQSKAIYCIFRLGHKLDEEVEFFTFKSAGVYWNSPAILLLSVFRYLPKFFSYRAECVMMNVYWAEVVTVL